MVQLPSAPSESGNSRSASAARCCAFCRITPASQVMVLDAVSTSRISSIRRIEITTSPLCGLAADQAGVAALRHSAMRCSVASLQIAETSAVDPGRKTSGSARETGCAPRDIRRDVGRIRHRVFVADDVLKRAISSGGNGGGWTIFILAYLVSMRSGRLPRLKG